MMLAWPSLYLNIVVAVMGLHWRYRADPDLHHPGNGMKALLHHLECTDLISDEVKSVSISDLAVLSK
jgi:hypothetical protein